MGRIVGFLPLVLAVAWLVVSAEEQSDTRKFFALWRTRDVLVSAGLVWLTAMWLLRDAGRKPLIVGVAIQLMAGSALVLMELAGLMGVIDYQQTLGGTTLGSFGFERQPYVDVAGESHEDAAHRWGLPTEAIAFSFKTDRYGFRNQHDRSESDIYLLGGSFLVGGLVPVDELLSARLERATAHKVMNLALLSLSLQAEADLLDDLDLPLRDRLVVQFVFEGNDLLDSRDYRRAADLAEAGPPERNSLWDRSLSHKLVRVVQRLTNPVAPEGLRQVGFVGGRLYTFLWTSLSFAGLEDQIPYALAAAESVRDHVSGRGGRYVAVFIPSKLRVLGPLASWPAGSILKDYSRHLNDEMRSAVVRWAGWSDVPLLDLTKALSESARAGRIPWFPGDTHWNAIGHEVAAAQLAQWGPIANRSNVAHGDDGAL